MDPLLVAMFVFSLTMSISPGPVNLVIVSSGAHHGVRRTLPYVSGATIGFTLLLMFVGFWFMRVISSHPLFLKGLGVAGSLFIMWLGYKIASASAELAVKEQSVPTFMQGFILQWLNPKAWIACASGAALFSSPDTHAPLLSFIAIYFVVCYLSLAAWAVLGERVSVLIDSAWRMRVFNLATGGLLLASAVYLLYSQLAV